MKRSCSGSISLPIVGIFSLLNVYYYFTVVLSCIFLKTNNVKHLFCAWLFIFSCEVSEVFAHLKNYVFGHKFFTSWHAYNHLYIKILLAFIKGLLLAKLL